MRIALAQLNYTIGDIDGNSAKIIEAVERAKSEAADVVIFAEQAISGTPAFDLLRKTTFLELCDDALERIASHCDTISAVVGLPLLTTDGTYSAAAVIQDRKVVRYVTKANISARREMGFLDGGDGSEVVTIAGEKVEIIVTTSAFQRASTERLRWLSILTHVVMVKAYFQTATKICMTLLSSTQRTSSLSTRWAVPARLSTTEVRALWTIRDT